MSPKGETEGTEPPNTLFIGTKRIIVKAKEDIFSLPKE